MKSRVAAGQKRREPEQPAIAVDVKPSRIHGKGVFTREAIPRRMRIGYVTGRLVPLPAARLKVEADQRIYLVELDDRTALDCSAGNAYRRLNHSCRPNCYLRVWNRRVEVYARGAISAGAELTVDYGRTPHRGGMPCSCGYPNCRKRL